MKKLFVFITLTVLFFYSSVPTLASASPKTTGSIGFDISGTPTYADFNAISTSVDCKYEWSLTGYYTVSFIVDDGPAFTNGLYIEQTDTIITTGYMNFSGISYWTISNGSVIGDNIDFTTSDSNGTNSSRVLHFTGNISTDGYLTGTWYGVWDGGYKSGTWSTSIGTDKKTSVAGCFGKGSFDLYNLNSLSYSAEIKLVKQDGSNSWFAGPVISGGTGNGSWLFVKVYDGGETGIGKDTISFSFVNETDAKNAVMSKANPSSTQYILTSGNLQVH